MIVYSVYLSTHIHAYISLRKVLKLVYIGVLGVALEVANLPFDKVGVVALLVPQYLVSEGVLQHSWQPHLKQDAH